MRVRGRADPEQLLADYYRIRGESEWLTLPLAVEDHVLQTLPETSPPKWHLAHTAWFFETFLLQPFLPHYRPFEPAWAYLFNSYYDSVGQQFPRPQRGLLSRPTVEEVKRYRAHVDTAMEHLLGDADGANAAEIVRRTTLGLHHEQQHQELLLMDIKHNFSVNPLRPSYHAPPPESEETPVLQAWLPFDGGEVWIGHNGDGFCYDNEQPRHRQFLEPFALANRPVTNGEYLHFMTEGGYERPELWLSDGWAARRAGGWGAPLYWERQDGAWWHYTLHGVVPVVAEAPVCHVSFFEADAYARWAGARLPLEGEWEHAAVTAEVVGNLRNSGRLHPQPAEDARPVLQQLFGDVWEWTQSPYVAYPGYRREGGAFGEYNGKFMCNQMVLRGGCCVTPDDHIRATYRNFFYPRDRWPFTGFRLAQWQ